MASCPRCGAAIRFGHLADGTLVTLDSHERVAGPSRYVERDKVLLPVDKSWSGLALVDHTSTCRMPQR